MLEGGEGCLSLCQPVSVPLYKAQWTDRMSYGSDALVTAVALKYTVVAESALADSHRYSLASSPPSPLFLFPRFISSCGKLKPSDPLLADVAALSSLVSFEEERCFFWFFLFFFPRSFLVHGAASFIPLDFPMLLRSFQLSGIVGPSVYNRSVTLQQRFYIQ